MQTQQKNSISQKQEISWHAKLTSDYGHMYVMLFPRHLQSATKLVETICHRGPLSRFASLEKLIKLPSSPTYYVMPLFKEKKTAQHWMKGRGGGHRCELFCSLKLPHLSTMYCFLLWSYFIQGQCLHATDCTLNLGRITSQQALLRPFPIAVYFCIISSFPFALHPSSHFTS